MSLPTALQDREYQKFSDISPGITAVRVTGENFSGDFITSGLRVAGKITVVTLNSSTWTALPATPLTGRNALAIQNEDTSVKVKVNYDNSASGFVGMTIFPNGGERQYNIADDIILYAKCEAGSIDVTVEELS